MAGSTKIEWTERTWNPVVGCSIVSPGCTNCYAMKMARRIEAMGVVNHYNGCTKVVNGNAVWSGKVALASEDILLQPLRRKKPTTYFVNSMGDLFHEDAPDEWIYKCFAVMKLAPQHTFQVLTKRAERMRRFLGSAEFKRTLDGRIWSLLGTPIGSKIKHGGAWQVTGPLPNVWLGVSTERQQEADERIPHLLQTPAAVRFISAEPLLGPISLHALNIGADHPSDALRGRALINGQTIQAHKLDWVIVGGESGPGARPMHPAWARSLRDWCSATGVRFFFKQWGQHVPINFDDLASEEIESDELAGKVVGFDDQPMHRVGKKAAGRLLDGREHNDMPERAA